MKLGSLFGIEFRNLFLQQLTPIVTEQIDFLIIFYNEIVC